MNHEDIVVEDNNLENFLPRVLKQDFWTTESKQAIEKQKYHRRDVSEDFYKTFFPLTILLTILGFNDECSWSRNYLKSLTTYFGRLILIFTSFMYVLNLLSIVITSTKMDWQL